MNDLEDNVDAIGISHAYSFTKVCSTLHGGGVIHSHSHEELGIWNETRKHDGNRWGRGCLRVHIRRNLHLGRVFRREASTNYGLQVRDVGLR